MEWKVVPSIPILRRCWHQLHLGTDIEFWELTPAEFQFLVSIKLGVKNGNIMNRTSLSELITKFQQADGDSKDG